MKQLAKAFFLGLCGFLVGVVVIYVNHMNKRPGLEVWHTAELTAELTADSIADLSDFELYRQRESTIFKQLDDEMSSVSRISSIAGLNRFLENSWSDPGRLTVNWNKTFEMEVKSPKVGVLMLHGLSDSPYSMRSLAMSLHDNGAWVLGLRLPGHGTAPAALTRVHWQDYAAAVRLAARHLRKVTGDNVPFYLVGYSNGAALSLEYTLSQMLGEDLPKPAGMVFISPAVSVSPMAFLASWNLLLAKLPGLEKLAWLSIAPEYDPYKYNSFAVNAGEQIYRLTKRIGKQINELRTVKGLEDFPPVIALQSAVDSTISPISIIDSFMNFLAPNGHKLVLFDVNRISADISLLKNDPQPMIDRLFGSRCPYGVALLTNQEADRRKVEVREKNEMGGEVTVTPLELSWPRGVYSLSHVALPFRDNDPAYGVLNAHDRVSFSLGALEAKGEKEVLQVPASDLIRLRFNPFFSFLERQTVEWIFGGSVSVSEH